MPMVGVVDIDNDNNSLNLMLSGRSADVSEPISSLVSRA